MADQTTDVLAAPAAPQAATQGVWLTDAQLTALLVAVKGHSPASVVVADVAAVNADVIARMKAVIADAEGAAGHVHGAAKALQADVKANWPLILVAVLAVAGFVLHFVKVFGFGG